MIEQFQDLRKVLYHSISLNFLLARIRKLRMLIRILVGIFINKLLHREIESRSLEVSAVLSSKALAWHRGYVSISPTTN